jgi:hypothetical protein
VLGSASFHRMGSKGQNPKPVDELLEYDRPDIILTYGSQPVLSLERTEEVPTGHNVGQRFARIVRAAELHVPCVYFFPFAAQKHGKETQEREAEMKTNQRYVNARLFDAIQQMERIHNSLVVPVCWPVDDHYELLRSTKKDAEVKEVVSAVVENTLKKGTIDDLRKVPSVVKAQESALREREARLKSQSRYASPPPSVEIVETRSLIDLHDDFGSSIRRLLSLRHESVVYTIGMNYIRADPYAGTLIVYDYAYARNGTSPRNRSRNLIANIPNIRTSEWERQSTKRKDISLFSKFADAILLRDGVVQ